VKSWVLQGDSSSPTRRCRLARDRSQKLKDAGGSGQAVRLPELRKMTEVFFDETKEIIHDDRKLMKLRLQWR
jgi:hypothetical protein